MSAVRADAATVMQSHVADSGDRRWSEAAADTIDELTGTVRHHAREIRGHVGVDAVHDMRTTTRRLRTAVDIFGADANATDRTAVEKELKRVARRLGAVHDLDVLLETLAETARAQAIDEDGLRALREAWEDERRSAARRLKAEIGRGRFRRSLRRARRLVSRAPERSGEPATDAGPIDRVVSRAPGLIWDAFGKVLSYDIDPATADAAVIHRLRIAAKQLRYTLEAFEDALEPGETLIGEVTALQDAAGEMHDAIVAADRAGRLAARPDLRERERSAIATFIGARRTHAEDLRPMVARRLAAIRRREFREALGRAVAAMGHVTPRGS